MERITEEGIRCTCIGKVMDKDFGIKFDSGDVVSPPESTSSQSKTSPRTGRTPHPGEDAGVSRPGMAISWPPGNTGPPVRATCISESCRWPSSDTRR